MSDFIKIINKLTDALENYPQWSGIKLNNEWYVYRGSMWYLRNINKNYTHMAFANEERFMEYMKTYNIDFDIKKFKNDCRRRLLEWA
jgi:hypothetical protein